jgi:tetratricopeptide (TPR) repeat protein
MRVSCFILAFLIAGTPALAQKPSDAPAVQSAPVGKPPPQAKTQQEFNDYQADQALSGGQAAEKAADDFAVKYPQSELREYLYSWAMREYQHENNPGKILVMGEKVLALDPDNTIALVLSATVLADILNDAEPDREQKIAKINEYSKNALQTLDIGFAAPPGATPDQVQAYKNTLQSLVHSALGITELKTRDFAGAEKDLLFAADVDKTGNDPYIWYHLALAQDRLATSLTNEDQKQEKYLQALASVNRALQYAGSNTDLVALVQAERARLERITGVLN